MAQVKGGHVSVAQIRDFAHVIDREEAAIGVFITLNDPTKPMNEESAGKGFYTAPDGSKYPKLQILTISDLIDGKGFRHPPFRRDITHKQAVRQSKAKNASQMKLDM